MAWTRAFQRNRTLVSGAVLTGLFLVVAAAAPLIAPGDPLRIGTHPLQPPSGAFIFGTDDLGRDVLQGVIHGARTSLAVGLLAAGTAGVIGMLAGGLAGYAGGYLDEAVMRVAELVQVVPRFFLALVGVTLIGPGLDTIVLLIGLTSWPLRARLMRGEVLRLRAQEYVTASLALGARDGRILLRAILPNALPPVIAQVALQVATAMLIEAGLAFLGLGDPTVISWGAMLHNSQRFMRQAWWLAAFPGLALSLAVLGSISWGMASPARGRLACARRMTHHRALECSLPAPVCTRVSFSRVYARPADLLPKHPHTPLDHRGRTLHASYRGPL